MTRTTGGRRRPAVHITLPRAARLHRLVRLLHAEPQPRDRLLSALSIGLRTFYRELELLKKCGIPVRVAEKAYLLRTSVEEAEGRLPFPDPQLSFSEMSELGRHPGPAAARLAALLASVVAEQEPAPKRGRRSGGTPATRNRRRGS